MKPQPLVVDVETQHTFREYPRAEDLKVSVAVAYDFSTGTPHVFREHELSKLFSLMEHASYLIGYNIRDFDLNVLKPYYNGNMESFAVFDMMNDIRDKIGKRIALSDLTSATLGKGKSGHGLKAIEWFKEGKWEELINYCRDDVLITKELFESGVRDGYVHYGADRDRIRVSWGKYLESVGSQDISLTLPF